jgi:hypothetical protein
MNIRRGIFRLTLTLWAFWVIVGVFNYYKELATLVGIDYWSDVATAQRIEDRCNDKNISDEICMWRRYGTPVKPDGIEKENAKKGSVEFFTFFILLPSALLIVLTAIFYLLRWIINGFRGNNAKT